MISRAQKKIIVISLLALFIVFTAAGSYKNQVAEVINNATLICFSCIGIK
jgi:hypothetical protein